MFFFTLITLCFTHLLRITSCEEPSLRFEVLADWGGIPVFPYKTFVELSVGREMAALASKFKLDAILALGDNFYLNGVKDVDDPRFKETFETAFDYDSLHIPWLIVAGNHDHYGNITAQIAYTQKSDRWYFPDLYYTKTFKIPESNVTVDLVMIDTVILCGNTDPKYPFEQPILESSDKHRRDKHWRWLDDTLRNSKANYLLVGGHYPVYSIGTHGPTECLVRDLQPMLEKYKVTSYLCGHDHNMQHIQVTKEDLNMDYFVIGSANIIDPSKKNLNNIPPNSLLFHWGDPFSLGAFANIDITTSNMTVNFILTNGKSMYTYSKPPRFY